MMSRVLAGEGRAMALFTVIARTLDGPPDCAACGCRTSMETVAAIAIVVPHVPTPRNSLVCAMCDKCASPDDQTLNETIQDFLKRAAWPDLRELPIVSWNDQGGHA